jgi:mannose-1-phosphate guanylyltransferase/mannose-6-phosphate isomerase
MQRIVAIMAGGRGERLWPHSRTRLPKQFLSIGGGPTFLQQTYDRVAGMPEAPGVIVLTASATIGLVQAQLPGLAPDHLLGEPRARDTATAAALAVAMARAVAGGECVLALVPADHACFDVPGFRKAIRAAWDAAERDGCPVLIGIPPSRPETGYGYILRGDPLPAPAGGPAVSVVERFVEKPNLETAAGYLAGGRSLWNSGICCCRTDVLSGALALHQPALGALLRRLDGRHPAAVPSERLAAWTEGLPAISLDYGVLEHLERALVVEAALAWDDVGGWEALRRLHPQDDAGNVVLGKAVLSRTADTAVYGAAAGRLVVTHGVRDLVVVDTPDSLLIAGRAALPDLKQALREVRAAGFGTHLDDLAAEAVARAAADPEEAAAPAVTTTEHGHAVAFPDCGVEVLHLQPGDAIDAAATGGRPLTLLAGAAALHRPGAPRAALAPGAAQVLPRGARVAAEQACLLLLGPEAPGEVAAAAPAEEPQIRAAGDCHHVEKPWGREVWWAHSRAYVGKRIEVASGHALSLQLHRRKHETLYFLEGEVRLRLGEEVQRMGPGDVAVVPPGTVHRIEALTDAVIFEVSTPEVEDVVRLEDRYGRAAEAPLP